MAIAWVRQQKALTPDRPFFMYFAPGATHTPHHVPTEWADKYKGRFDGGWDALREETFAKQKELGVIAPDAELTARHDEIPAWHGHRRASGVRCWPARWRTTPASWSSPTTTSGRLVDALAEMELLDDTRRLLHHRRQRRLSRRNRLTGTFNAMAGPNGGADLESVEFVREHIGRDRPAVLLPPLRRRLGARAVHAVSVDQAGRLALGRHPQRHDRALPEPDPGARRAAPPVHATSSTSPRRSWSSPGSPSPRRCTASRRSRWRARAWRTPSTTGPPRSATRRSTSRCSATAASTTRAGAR